MRRFLPSWGFCVPAGKLLLAPVCCPVAPPLRSVGTLDLSVASHSHCVRVTLLVGAYVSVIGRGDDVDRGLPGGELLG